MWYLVVFSWRNFGIPQKKSLATLVGRTPSDPHSQSSFYRSNLLTNSNNLKPPQLVTMEAFIGKYERTAAEKYEEFLKVQ